MAGEDSNSSGKIGESIAAALLEKIGWHHQIHNISIGCNNENHLNSSGNPKKSHGEDIVYIYDTPFHDNRTVVAHISVKHKTGGYSERESDVNREFKNYVKELEQIIECAKYDKKINSLIESFDAKVDLQHIGILVWLHNDAKTIDKNILPIIAKSRPDLEGSTPYYIIDSGRASFLLKVISNLNGKAKEGAYQFYYPKIGTGVLVDLDRKGNRLPIELVVSDIIPAFITIKGENHFYLYSREEFDELTYENLMAYALEFTSGLVNKIYIGFPSYNSAKDDNVANEIRLSFKDRNEEISPFSYNETVLDLFKR